jgi:DNA-binding Lrp family transcriptional regulator
VAYRIERLLERKIIWKFFPIFDFHKVGVYSYDLFIKLKATKEEEEKIKEYFRNHPNVVWATTLFGKWDLFVQVIAKNMWDFETVLDKIVEHLGEKLDFYDAKLMVKRVKINHQLFDVKIDYKFLPAKSDYSNIYKLDELDKKILVYLNEKNAVAQYATIAVAVDSTLETVRNRIRSLLKEGVITKFYPFVRHENIGLVRYLVIIDFRHLTKEMEEKIIDYVTEQKGINLAFKTIGRSEMYFWVVGENPSDIEAMIKKMQIKFSSVITNMEPMLTTEELTLNFFPAAMNKM